MCLGECLNRIQFAKRFRGHLGVRLCGSLGMIRGLMLHVDSEVEMMAEVVTLMHWALSVAVAALSASELAVDRIHTFCPR
jgi:hypothetical protein